MIEQFHAYFICANTKYMFEKLKAYFNNKPLEKQTVDDTILKLQALEKFLGQLAYKKVMELKAKNAKKPLTAIEIKNGLVFEHIPLTTDDKVKIINHDYQPIEYRLYLLKEHELYEEMVLIAMMFLVGEQNIKFLYRKELKPSSIHFRTIVYFFCIALLETNNKVLCQGYIDLLQKLVLIYPDKNNPPQDLIDKIGFRSHSNSF